MAWTWSALVNRWNSGNSPQVASTEAGAEGEGPAVAVAVDSASDFEEVVGVEGKNS